MVGDILPPTVEICQDETQFQPMEEESLFEYTIEEQPQEITNSTPRARLSQQAHSNGSYTAEKKRLKIERMRLKNVNLEMKNLKLQKQLQLLDKQLKQSQEK